MSMLWLLPIFRFGAHALVVFITGIRRMRPGLLSVIDIGAGYFQRLHTDLIEEIKREADSIGSHLWSEIRLSLVSRKNTHKKNPALRRMRA